MTINSLTSSAASQLAYTNRLSGTSASGTRQTQGGGPPPPPDDGGGLIGAIADALKSIGVAGTASSDDTSTTDGTATDTTTTDAGATDTANAAQALGSFLDSLMGALHAQQGEGAGGPPPYGEPPQGGGIGGPGKLSSDLQSLMTELGEAGNSSGTDSTDSSVSALQSSFKNLLTALGGSGDDADAQLSGFLQALAGKLPFAGSSGNLIDTSA